MVLPFYLIVNRCEDLQLRTVRMIDNRKSLTPGVEEKGEKNTFVQRLS
jgi:hypothetical protein